MPEVNVTTVFFGKTAGEEEAAHEIAKVLGVQAAPRTRAAGAAAGCRGCRRHLIDLTDPHCGCYAL